MKKTNLSATQQIVIALLLGILAGLAANYYGYTAFIIKWIKPLGDVFIQSLRLIAIPLIFVSLTHGIIELKNLSKLSRLGGRSVIAYLVSTVLAVTIGLLLVNMLGPGLYITEVTRMGLLAEFAGVPEIKNTGSSDTNFLLELIPENLFEAIADNGNMLSIIFMTIVFATAILKSGEKTRANLANFFSDLNIVVMKIIEFIMLFAPLGVFALMATLTAETPKADLMFSLIGYALTVVLGLSILVFVVYPFIVKRFTGLSNTEFLKGISRAQLMGISTSSSAATLPVTMECVRNNLKVSNETASFVLPIGATCNMDGTSLYQAVAAVFIAQIYGIDLSFFAQLSIVATATLASIGAAAVPGAGIVMLSIVLEQAGIPLSGLGLILALDRPLDMLRTAVNITSDAAIAKIMDS